MNMKSKKHAWHDDWIFVHYDEYTSQSAMCRAYNDIFGTCYRQCSFNKHLREELGIFCNYSKEEKAWFKKFYPKNGIRRTISAFKDIYGRDVSRQAVIGLAHQLGVVVERDVANRNRAEVVRREGSKRAERNPGSIRSDKNYYKMKAEDGSWKTAGKVIWEKAYGPLSDDYVVIYLDGDTTNYSLENLMAIHRSIHSRMNGNRFKCIDPELSKTMIAWCKLDKALKEAKKYD